MNATVKSDVTRRTIQIEIVPGSVPDIDVTRSYHKKPRLFRPDSVTLVLVDGKLNSVRTTGGLVLKSGGASAEIRDDQNWYSTELASLPEWLKELATSAPAGCISWIEIKPQPL